MLARLIACSLLAMGLAGYQQQSQETVTVPINQVRADLETISKARIYFAHQSVGRNILKGLGDLSAEAGVPLRIEEIKGTAPPEGPGLFHANVGENGVADSKLSAFASDVSAAASTGYDVALLKFCYTDIGGEARDQSAQKLFDRYQKTIAEVRAQQPGLKVMHVTIPLRADPPGWKTTVKRWLGRPVLSDEGNLKRGDYNELLRAAAAPAELFDVARLEATRADGTISAFSAGGREVESLAPEHTYDGGHLNDPAKRYFAAAFLHSLAEAVRQR